MDAFEFLRQLRDGTWRDTTAQSAAIEPVEERYELGPEEEEALEQSIAEIERGECVTAEQLFAELRTIRLRDDG